MHVSVQHFISLIYVYCDISIAIKLAFGSREFLFLICVQKAVSMQTLVLCAINILVYRVVFKSCLCRKPSLARTSLVRVFDTNNS